MSRTKIILLAALGLAGLAVVFFLMKGKGRLQQVPEAGGPVDPNAVGFVDPNHLMRVQLDQQAEALKAAALQQTKETINSLQVKWLKTCQAAALGLTEDGKTLPAYLKTAYQAPCKLYGFPY